MTTPSTKTLVWPVAESIGQTSWDPDYPAGTTARPAPYHTIHVPYEPLTSPRIATDQAGIRYPIAADIQPRLAKWWESSDGDRTWTIHLRRGIRSNHGNELTAESVRWSWERVYRIPARTGTWRSRHLAGLASHEQIEVLDDHTLRFRLERPNPEFPQYLSFATNNVFDATEAKRHASDSDPYATRWLGANIAGFGAFELVETGGGARTFRARDDYWAGRPGVDTLVQVGVDHRDQAMRLLERGEANLLLGLFPEELSRFAGRPEYRILRVRANHSTLEFNWKEAPFDDRRVRQAICYALPYARILDQVYRGMATQSKTPIPSVSKYSTDEFWHYETDLDRAKILMKESRYPGGFRTELILRPSYESLRFAEIVRQALLPLGIVVEARHETSLPMGRKAPMWFKEECGHALYEAMYDLGHDYDPMPGMWSNKFIADPRFTEAMRRIRFAESADQPALYREIQRDIVEFAPCAHIAEVQTGWVFRGDIDPWALGPHFLGAQTTVWSTHRQMIGRW